MPASDASSVGFHDARHAASLVVWLASEESGHGTGKFFGIDGPRLSLVDRPAAHVWTTERSNWTPEEIAAKLSDAEDLGPAHVDASAMLLTPAPTAQPSSVRPARSARSLTSHRPKGWVR